MLKRTTSTPDMRSLATPARSAPETLPQGSSMDAMARSLGLLSLEEFNQISEIQKSRALSLNEYVFSDTDTPPGPSSAEKELDSWEFTSTPPTSGRSQYSDVDPGTIEVRVATVAAQSILKKKEKKLPRNISFLSERFETPFHKDRPTEDVASTPKITAPVALS